MLSADTLVDEQFDLAWTTFRPALPIGAIQYKLHFRRLFGAGLEASGVKLVRLSGIEQEQVRQEARREVAVWLAKKAETEIRECDRTAYLRIAKILVSAA